MSGAGAAGLPPGGVYLLLVRLEAPRTVRAGRLGRIRLEAGRYAYAGSAQRALAARLARHGRRRKRRHWHVDGLTAAGTVEGAWVWPLAKNAECRLAGELVAAGLAARAVPGFGASDCRCGGHLVRTGTGVSPAALERGLAATLGRGLWWEKR